MCNGAYFHTTNYYDPFWRTAPQPGPTDFINALFTFDASNSDQFLCEFIDKLADGLTVLAPEFAVEDVELEEGIDTLCCLADGGCSLGTAQADELDFGVSAFCSWEFQVKRLFCSFRR